MYLPLYLSVSVSISVCLILYLYSIPISSSTSRYLCPYLSLAIYTHIYFYIHTYIRTGFMGACGPALMSSHRLPALRHSEVWTQHSCGPPPQLGFRDQIPDCRPRFKGKGHHTA